MSIRKQVFPSYTNRKGKKIKATRAVKFEYSHWIPRSRESNYLYFANNAGRIAKEHGVKPWDLVFGITSTIRILR